MQISKKVSVYCWNYSVKVIKEIVQIEYYTRSVKILIKGIFLEILPGNSISNASSATLIVLKVNSDK